MCTKWDFQGLWVMTFCHRDDVYKYVSALWLHGSFLRIPLHNLAC